MVETTKLPSNADNTTSDRTGKDITNEFEVDTDEVELFSIEELVPSSTPLTVPYLEVYRTNELEYVPYVSPYNVGIQSSSSDSSSSTDSSSTNSTDPNSTDPNNPNSTNSNDPNASNSDSNNTNNSTDTSGSSVNP